MIVETLDRMVEYMQVVTYYALNLALPILIYGFIGGLMLAMIKLCI